QAVAPRPPLELPPRLLRDVEVLEGNNVQAVLRADVHAPAAQNALLGVVDRLDVADQAPRRLDPRLFLAVSRLDFGDPGAAADIQSRRRFAVEDLETRDHPVEGRRNLLDRELRGQLAGLAGEVTVDRARGPLSVGDRLDQVARSEGDVAAGED